MRGVVVREEGAALVDVHDVHPEDDAVPLDHLLQPRRLQVEMVERRAAPVVIDRPGRQMM